MAVLSTTDDFVELLRKSGVLDETTLTEYLTKLRRSSFPTEVKALASALVRDGLLTHFQARQLLIGKWMGFTLGKYRVLEHLGDGGMGKVYLCEHLVMRRLVAVKVLPSRQLEQPGALERFHREARAVGALDHPNIVHAYDVDCVDRMHYLVMEFVDGSSLHDIVSKHGPLSPLRAAHYIRQAAQGLQHAHLAGWVHRDIKPGNILLDRQGVIKILDMGLARMFDDANDAITKNFDDNAVLGTADYLAPEQAVNSSDVDIRADIYSLGATFYFLLCGKAPFEEGKVAQKLLWHQMKPPTPLRDRNPQVPEGLAAIVDKMMAKDKTQRYQTPAEVVAALVPWTKTAIPPPASEELPRHCLAIRRRMQHDGGARTATDMDTSHQDADYLTLTDMSMALSRRADAAADANAQPVPISKWGIVIVATVFVLFGGSLAFWLAFFPTPPTPSASSARPGTSASATMHTTPPSTLLANQHNPDGVIDAAEAAKHVKKKCTVAMTVRATGVAKNGTTIFLNSETDFRSPMNFNVVMHKTTVDKFQKKGIPAPADYFKNKRIHVTGTIEEYDNKPQIVVTDPDQIQVVAKKD
ncbi:MAG: protein kinase domain-containing protein [Gemmataceae bacterium]